MVYLSGGLVEEVEKGKAMKPDPVAPRVEPHDPDRRKGLYGKYFIQRHDPERKHENCFYFVLDTDHDPFALPALRAYVLACREKYPQLASDLEGVVKAMTIKLGFKP